MRSSVSCLILFAFATGAVLRAESIYAFGDSLSDAGNAFALTGGVTPGPPYSGGRFTNGNVWVQDLALDLGLSAITPSWMGGTDYAVGGAESGNTLFHSAGPTDLPAQIASYQGAHPVADPNALYTIWIGSNDLADITSSDPGVVGADFGLIAGNIVDSIDTLAGEGAKNFLVLDVPDLGKTPEALAGGIGASAIDSGLAAEFDYDVLIPALSSIFDMNLSVLDTYALVDSFVANPSTYGFNDVTDACVTGVNYAIFSGGTPCAAPDTYLFWDREHPTAAADVFLASAAQDLVTPEPSSLALAALGGLCLLVVRRRR